MTATLRLKTKQLAKIRGWVGLTTDAALAERMGVDPGNLSRVLRGKQQPGPVFIAAMCTALNHWCSDHPPRDHPTSLDREGQSGSSIAKWATSHINGALG